MPEPVLVTGGTGFVGSYLIRTLLSRGTRVRALARPDSNRALLGEDAQRVEWVEGDILDVLSLERAMEEVAAVYHCAAVVSMKHSERAHMIKVNAEGTANVVNAALAAGRPKMLYISSIAAIGRHPGRREIDETCTWEDSPLNTDYAVSKQLAEREAFRGIAEGLEVVIVNPAMIIGAGFWDRGTAAVFGRVDRGLKFYTAGSNGMVDVRDVVEAATELMDRGTPNRRYILSGENMDFRTFFQYMAKALDRDPPKFKAGSALLSIAWRWEVFKSRLTGAEPVLTRQSAVIASEPFRFDNSRVREEIGFVFRPIEQSIADSAKAYQEAKAEGRNWSVLPIRKPALDAVGS